MITYIGSVLAMQLVGITTVAVFSSKSSLADASRHTGTSGSSIPDGISRFSVRVDHGEDQGAVHLRIGERSGTVFDAATTMSSNAPTLRSTKCTVTVVAAAKVTRYEVMSMWSRLSPWSLDIGANRDDHTDDRGTEHHQRDALDDPSHPDVLPPDQRDSRRPSERIDSATKGVKTGMTTRAHGGGATGQGIRQRTLPIVTQLAQRAWWLP